MAITNHLATVFRVPGQKFFGWLRSGMAITNDLPSVVCWVITSHFATVLWWLSGLASFFISQMASSFISYFLLLRQNKVTKEKATPVCRPCGVPSISRKQAGLRNSTWRGAHPRAPLRDSNITSDLSLIHI